MLKCIHLFLCEYICLSSAHVHTHLLISFMHAHKHTLSLSLSIHTESVCPVMTMVVSPHNQTPVQGLANILRYLIREYSPSLYEGQGAERASEIDSWLDTVTNVLLASKSSAKEKASIARKMNSRLGGNGYLVGDQLSLADLVAYWAVCGQGAIKLTNNIKDWLTRVYTDVPSMGTFPCLCIE